MLLSNRAYTNVQLTKNTTISLSINDEGLTNVTLTDDDGAVTITNVQDIGMTLSTVPSSSEGEG